MKKYHFIYQTTNLINSKYYVGKKGLEPWNKGIKTGPMSEKSKKLKSIASKNQPKFPCMFCDKVLNKGNLIQYRNENCKKYKDKK